MNKERKVEWTILFVAVFILGAVIGYAALISDNPDLGITDNETKVCQPDAMPVNVSKYYDNESKVCWKPLEDNNTNVSGDVNAGQ